MHGELRCPDGHPNEPPSVFCTTCGLPLPKPTERDLDATRTTPVAQSGGAPSTVFPVIAPFGHGATLPPPPVVGGKGPGSASSAPSKKVWPVIVIAVLAFLVVGLGTAFLVTSRKPAPVANRTISHPSATPAPQAPVPTAAPVNPEQQQATELANLLSNSTVDRTQVVNAAGDIGSCGDLQSDETTLSQAQSSRQNLVNQLQALSLASLPPGLVTDLVNAWNASASSDGYYAAWAADEISAFSGCTQGDTGDSNYQNAASSDVQATNAKDAFVAAWNPVAQQFGLTTYQSSQL